MDHRALFPPLRASSPLPQVHPNFWKMQTLWIFTCASDPLVVELGCFFILRTRTRTRMRRTASDAHMMELPEDQGTKKSSGMTEGRRTAQLTWSRLEPRLSVVLPEAAQRAEGVQLLVEPRRLQFFQHEAATLHCEDFGGPTGWRFLYRREENEREEEPPSCSTKRGSSAGASCTITSLYPHDTGRYWCESGTGSSSGSVRLEVTDGPVILESPALPPALGDSVTLRCTERTPQSTNQTTSAKRLVTFYRNGVQLHSGESLEMSRTSWSREDPGLYKCVIAGVGESPQSQLSVRGVGQDDEELRPPGHLLATVSLLAVLLVVGLLLLAIKLRPQAANQLQSENAYYWTPDSPQLQPAAAEGSFYSELQEVRWCPPETSRPPEEL